MCMSIVVLSILLKNMYALFHFKGLKLTFGIREDYWLQGMPLLLRVWLIFDRESLSWVCDKLGFSGSSAMVILVLKENGE
jgi:hypothetical protein